MQISTNQLLTFHWLRQNFFLQPRVGGIADSQIGLYGAAPTCYLTLLARDPAYSFAGLDRALYEERTLARVRAMRLTQFMLPGEWVPLAHQAGGKRGAEAFRQLMEKTGLPLQQAEPVIRSTLELLAEQDLTVSEIKKALGIQSGPIAGAFSYLISMLCQEGRLIRARVRGSRKSNLYTYTRFERWLPDVDLDSASPEDARRELARLYLAAYGPARPVDFQWWAGLSQDEATAALEELGGSILRLQVDSEGPYYMLKSDSASLLQVPDQPPRGFAFLPVWDAYLMAYADRSIFVPDAWYDRVYVGGGNATSTVLVDGRAAGVWAFELKQGRLEIRVGYFYDPPPGARDAAEAHGRRLAEQIGARDLAILRCPAPPLLGPAARSRFQSPLKG